jgi:hypothetical protein
MKYIPVYYDKDEDKCHIKINFREVQKYIPYKFLKKVWDDNNVFSSERLVNNHDFFRLFESMLRQENIYEQREDKEKCDKIFELAFTLMFNMLPYVFHNETINSISN